MRVTIKESKKPFIFNKNTLNVTKTKWMEFSKITKGLTIVTILVLIGSFVSLAYFIQYSFPTSYTTSLSLIDQNGESISKIRTAVDEKIDLGVRIVNNEIKYMRYYLEIWICNQTFSNIENINPNNINLTLIASYEILLLKNVAYDYMFNFSIADFGLWYIIPIVFKGESPEPTNFNQTYEDIVRGILNSRINPVIEMKEQNIIGLWIQADILNYRKIDNGNSLVNDYWLTSSNGWNWSIFSDGINYGGSRNEGFIELYSNDTNSELQIETAIDKESMFHYINRIGIEVQLAPSTDLEAVEYFGISLGINYNESYTIEAQIIANATHLIMGFDNLELVGNKNYQKTVIAYNWTQDTFHEMNIYADFNSKWITFTFDNITYRSTTLDKNYVLEANKVSIILKNKDGYTNSAIKIDNFEATWEDKPVPLFDLNNYRDDNGDSYKDSWYTSSQGWNWEINTNSGNYSGVRENGTFNVTNFDESSYIALQTSLNDNFLIRTGNKLIFRVNMTYFSEASNFSTFGISLDLRRSSVNYRAVILSNTTHLLMGITSLFTLDGIFYTQSIIAYNWSIGEYHELQINADFSGKWLAFICDSTIYRLTISDSIYILGYNKAVIIMDSANLASESVIGITNFKVCWEEWYNPEETILILSEIDMQHIVLLISKKVFDGIIDLEFNEIDRIKKNKQF